MEMIRQLHQRALHAAKNFRRAESELIAILQEIETQKVYVSLGYASLYAYAVEELKLSESNASNFICVARKSREIPALKVEIEKGEITVSKARKIAPVLTADNAELWLEKARTLPKHLLEQEVARERPETELLTRFRFVTSERLHLELGVSEEVMEELIRVQDLLSQKRQEAVTLEECLGALTKEYLDRHDPVRRAERILKKKIPANSSVPGHTPGDGRDSCVSEPESPGDPVPGAKDQILYDLGYMDLKRIALKQTVRHEVNRRDRGQCTYVHPNGRRCREQRWVELHHIIPVSQGGVDTAENLTTLCFRHHRALHERRIGLKRLGGVSQQPLFG